MVAPKLRFREFSGEWVEQTLGDISYFLDNKRIPLSEIERTVRKGKYPYYGASGIIDYIDDFIFDGEYILLGEDGANILTRSTRLAFVISGKCWINNHAHVIQAKGSPYFLAEALERINYEQYNSGTVQPKLNIKSCLGIKLKNPELKEQTKIANFLSAVGERIQQVSQTHALLTQYKTGVMQKIFSQELRFKDENGKAFGAWEKKTIADIADVKGGKRLPKGYSLEKYNNGYPYITVSDMENGTIRLDGIKYVPKEVVSSIKRYTISTEDIYISVAGTLGLIGKVPPSLNGANLTENADKLTNIKVNKDFLLHFLSAGSLSKLIESSSTNNAQPKLALYAIAAMTFTAPALPEQTKIANFLSAIDDKINQAQSQLSALQDYKRGLLQQMFI